MVVDEEEKEEEFTWGGDQEEVDGAEAQVSEWEGEEGSVEALGDAGESAQRGGFCRGRRGVPGAARGGQGVCWEFAV